jgi:hypothetical protein
VPLTAESLARDVTACLADYPATIVHRGATVAGTASPVESADVFEDAGVEPVETVEFVAVTAAWTNAPREKLDRVTYLGADWTIGTVRVDPGAYTVRLVKEQ